MTNDRIRPIEDFVKSTMDAVTVPDLEVAHDFKHVDRVRRWALQIATIEGYPDLDQVEDAALLHDIGLAHVEQRGQHAPVGAEIAARFLRERGLFDKREIDTCAQFAGRRRCVGRDLARRRQARLRD